MVCVVLYFSHYKLLTPVRTQGLAVNAEMSYAILGPVDGSSKGVKLVAMERKEPLQDILVPLGLTTLHGEISGMFPFIPSSMFSLQPLL